MIIKFLSVDSVFNKNIEVELSFLTNRNGLCVTEKMAYLYYR